MVSHPTAPMDRNNRYSLRPNITGKNIQYLQVGSGVGTPVRDGSQPTDLIVGEANASSDVSTFFYQKPGTSTTYVTYAGYLRNRTTVSEITPTGGTKYLRQDNVLDRAAFVFGERTPNSAVPTRTQLGCAGDRLKPIDIRARRPASGREGARPDRRSKWARPASASTGDCRSSS